MISQGIPQTKVIIISPLIWFEKQSEIFGRMNILQVIQAHWVAKSGDYNSLLSSYYGGNYFISMYIRNVFIWKKKKEKEFVWHSLMKTEWQTVDSYHCRRNCYIPSQGWTKGLSLLILRKITNKNTTRRLRLLLYLSQSLSTKTIVLYYWKCPNIFKTVNCWFMSPSQIFNMSNFSNTKHSANI